MARWKYRIAALGLEAGYFSGLSAFAGRRAAGHGVILKFQRVKPRSSHPFQPLKAQEITPEFLAKVIVDLRRAGFDIVSLDEACARSRLPSTGRRYAVLTFDGGSSDFKLHAYPVLRAQHVPFVTYIPTGFIDGIAFPWWLVLEKLIAQIPRISLVMNDEERRFRSTSIAEKHLVFEAIYQGLRSLPPSDTEIAVKDLCARYSIDHRPIIRDASMNWADILHLSEDENATIGSATVSFPALSHLSAQAALRDMRMGRSVLESVLGRDCRHFAYPFGDNDAVSNRDIALAQDAGFMSAVTSQSGSIAPGGPASLVDLPRLAWDGRYGSTRILRTLMAKATLRGAKLTAGH